MLIAHLFLLALTLSDDDSLAANSAMTCERVTEGASLDDLQERLRLEWMSKTDTLTGHTAVVDTAEGETAIIESITESAVATYKADSDLTFHKFNINGREWLCVTQ
ncbi:hypothetical protein E4188_22535 (plasmid) [Aeromonas media]|uniref:Uncharacterized protein n=1 Tax=Aeromonas media TaxID=651 RepID=A0ABX6NY20_AERME|nr:hypothetical protein [Aeromonas media]QJT37117.1 hypothetical protein E4187_22785 [Aeromonas media]QJT41279.1 hypothetical protein E4188_22535 [Aeromonas media]